jgi:IS30 family transposase
VGRGRWLDEGAVAAAIEAVVGGATLAEAAAAANISKRSLQVRFEESGRTRRRVPKSGRKGRPDHVVRAGLELVRRGAFIKDAAAAVGMPASTLAGRVRAHGVVMGQARKRRPSDLRADERDEIVLGIERGESDAEIGTRLGRHRATIWRQIKRNGGRRAYRPASADARADDMASRPRPRWFEERPWLWELVVAWMLAETWSPQAVARRLRQAHSEEPEWWVSHEAIYQALYLQARGELRKELLRCLRTGRVRRKPQGRAHRSEAKILGMVNISERPAEAAERAVPGHWEGDLIIGEGGHSAVATLVERTSRYGMLIKLESKNAEHVAVRLAEHIVTLPRHLVRSLTWDQGTEMAAHVALSIAAGVSVYFADPHAPWQRPSNENWNGHARYFLPKGTDLSVHSQEDLDTYARKINGRPREILEWKTAAEVFEQLVVADTG